MWFIVYLRHCTELEVYLEWDIEATSEQDAIEGTLDNFPATAGFIVDKVQRVWIN